MAASKLALCNMALARLGNPQTLQQTDLDNNTNNAALICNALYNDVLRTVISEHMWSCCLTRVTISANGTAPNHGYAYRYAVPSDCLQVLEMNSSSAYNDFVVESGWILSNDSVCKILYLFENTTVTTWNIFLERAFLAKFVAELCMGTTGDLRRYSGYLQAYQFELQNCITMDSMQGSHQIISSSTLSDVRDGLDLLGV